MFVTIVAFDDFTDIDVFLPWDLLNRVAVPDWSVNILADTDPVTSASGLQIPVHGPLTETAGADAVLIASGPNRVTSNMGMIPPGERLLFDLRFYAHNPCCVPVSNPVQFRLAFYALDMDNPANIPPTP